MTTRTRLSLDGAWDFQLDPTDSADLDAIPTWRTAQVPMPWQAQFDDLRLSSGTAWYRRTFDYAPPEAGNVAILHFGAVDYLATVWLNGHRLGEHEGGYLPFDFDATPYLVAGENTVVVRAIDSSDDRARYAEYPFSEVPHGKQSWYGPIGGIWQSVWIEQCPALHVQAVRLTPDVPSGSIAITATLSAALPAGATVEATVLDPSGATVAQAALDAAGQGTAKLPGAPQLWSTDTPALYTVRVSVHGAGPANADVFEATCGFRTVEARAGRIYLNGQPVYLRGVLDQAYYPETIYTPPSLEYLEDQARKAKALGLNCLRIHIKIEDPRYYDVADRLGLLVWTEIPNSALLTPDSDRRHKQTFVEMVARDWNHPSIIIWTLINENWGTDLTRNPAHRRWLIDFYHYAKQVDPTRLIVDNSACQTNAHVAGDIEDYHPYKAIPDHADQWDRWVDEFADRDSDWIWYPDCLSERRPDLPLLVSEFGNWGLPDPSKLDERGAEPWWFQTGHEWGEGIVHPHGMRQRFDFYGLDEVFGSFGNFIQVSQEHMARSLHYEISSMRLRSEVGGYVITEFTDVHWECNGLLTMQRQVKHGLRSIFVPVNQDNVVIIRPQVWSGRPGESVAVELRALGVDGLRSDGVIQWWTTTMGGELPAPGGVVQVPLPGPGMVTLQVRWMNQDGGEIAANQVELACVLPDVPSTPLAVLDDRRLANELRALGYNVVDGSPARAAAAGAILVAQRYTKKLQEAIQLGARVLLVVDDDFGTHESEIKLPVGAILTRKNTAWQGDWATSFSWLKKQGPFSALPGYPLLEMEYADLMPDAVHAGLANWVTRSHSWAGLALGWIHKPVSLLSVLPYGNGKLAVTTFKLNADTLPRNVVAQALWSGITQLL